MKTKDIIGLSLWPPRKLLSDKKMAWLKEQVKKNGWHDPHPETLDLYLLPNRKYIVSYGGNHRPVLANKLGIYEIQTNVEIIIPKSFTDTKVSVEIANLKNKIKNIEDDASRLNRYLMSKGARRMYCNAEEQHLDKMFFNCDKLYSEINQLLKAQAMKCNLLPSHFNQKD